MANHFLVLCTKSDGASNSTVQLYHWIFQTQPYKVYLLVWVVAPLQQAPSFYWAWTTASVAREVDWSLCSSVWVELQVYKHSSSEWACIRPLPSVSVVAWSCCCLSLRLTLHSCSSPRRASWFSQWRQPGRAGLADGIGGYGALEIDDWCMCVWVDYHSNQQLHIDIVQLMAWGVGWGGVGWDKINIGIGRQTLGSVWQWSSQQHALSWSELCNNQLFYDW